MSNSKKVTKGRKRRAYRTKNRYETMKEHLEPMGYSIDPNFSEGLSKNHHRGFWSLVEDLGSEYRLSLIRKGRADKLYLEETFYNFKNFRDLDHRCVVLSELYLGFLDFAPEGKDKIVDFVQYGKEAKEIVASKEKNDILQRKLDYLKEKEAHRDESLIAERDDLLRKVSLLKRDLRVAEKKIENKKADINVLKRERNNLLDRVDSFYNIENKHQKVVEKLQGSIRVLQDSNWSLRQENEYLDGRLRLRVNENLSDIQSNTNSSKRRSSSSSLDRKSVFSIYGGLFFSFFKVASIIFGIGFFLYGLFWGVEEFMRHLLHLN